MHPRRHIRRRIADRLLASLDELVRRHRALALHSEHVDLHAELITAEVAHQLAMARRARCTVTLITLVARRGGRTGPGYQRDRLLGELQRGRDAGPDHATVTGRARRPVFRRSARPVRASTSARRRAPRSAAVPAPGAADSGPLTMMLIRPPSSSSSSSSSSKESSTRASSTSECRARLVTASITIR